MRLLEILNPVAFPPAALLAGYLLDLAVGDPERLPHPVRWVGRLISSLEGLLRKAASTPVGLRAAGAALAVLTVSLVYGASLIVLFVSYELSAYLGFAVSALMVWAGLSARSLADEARGVLGSLEGGGIEAARKRLSRIVGRDTDNLSEADVLRATVETVAENSSDGVVAPFFYLALGGPALMMAYKAVNTLDSMVGYKNDRYRDFGWFSARLDDAANFIPARLAGALAAASAFILGYNWKGSFRIMLRDGRKHPSPNSGVPEAAFAGALGVALGGPSAYGGVPSVKPVIGEAAAAVDRSTVRRAIRLLGLLAFLSFLLALITRTAMIFVL